MSTPAHVSLHGVLLEIAGQGVLVTGASGIGKGQLALALIQRGHRLVADDAPQFTLAAPGLIHGGALPALRHFLVVRPLGVLNIEALYGAQAVLDQVTLDLIVRLEAGSAAAYGIDNLPTRARRVLGNDVPELTLHVAQGYNLPVLIECLVRNHTLQLQGYHADRDFTARQQHEINKGQS